MLSECILYKSLVKHVKIGFLMKINNNFNFCFLNYFQNFCPKVNNHQNKKEISLLFKDTSEDKNTNLRHIFTLLDYQTSYYDVILSCLCMVHLHGKKLQNIKRWGKQQGFLLNSLFEGLINASENTCLCPPVLY